MYMSIFIICSNGQVIQNWKYGLPLSPKLYRTDVFKHLVTETVSSKVWSIRSVCPAQIQNKWDPAIMCYIMSQS